MGALSGDGEGGTCCGVGGSCDGDERVGDGDGREAVCSWPAEGGADDEGFKVSCTDSAEILILMSLSLVLIVEALSFLVQLILEWMFLSDCFGDTVVSLETSEKNHDVTLMWHVCVCVCECVCV